MSETKGLLLQKQALETMRTASTEDPRYSLNGILIEPDGSTVGTDGHILHKYTPGKAPAEFPPIEGIELDGPEADPFILPLDACKALKKAFPAKSAKTLPILREYAAVDTAQTNANGNAVIAVTDLENPTVFRPKKIDGAFPTYENVVPKYETPAIGIDPKLLKRLCETWIAQGFETVAMQTADTETEQKPIRFDAKCAAGTCTSVLMPKILK